MGCKSRRSSPINIPSKPFNSEHLHSNIIKDNHRTKLFRLIPIIKHGRNLV